MPLLTPSEKESAGMEKKKWDDIPSLPGLGVDWEFQPENPNGKRAHTRMDEKVLTSLFDGQRIQVKVATLETTLTGSLHDISEGGLAVQLDCRLAENQAIRVGLFLGTEKIISGAVVKHVQSRGRAHTTGVKFIGLGRNERQHISSLYASKVLKHAL
jgi:hypothetical protein